MVKVIWNKTASLPQMNVSIAFIRWRQCALPCGHIGATWQILLNLCFLQTTSPQSKRQINWFSLFLCTAHGRVSSGYIGTTWRIRSKLRTMAPLCEYDWTSASLGPLKFTIQTANRSIQVQPFLRNSWQKVPILYNGQLFPPKLPLLMGGSGHRSNSWFLGPYPSP